MFMHKNCRIILSKVTKPLVNSGFSRNQLRP
nr:MAG TPA: hypothetical protein [Caudoviricetes sp.]DAV67115.1 MAG TPA: hypothetical protein [Caudoviricetes sp.]